MSAPKLQDRLQRLADLIAEKCPGSRCHADIGSDHGLLLRYLLENAIVERGIAGELRSTPLANSKRQLEGLACDVRHGNGLEVLRPGEASSLSISGMGDQTIISILSKHPACLPRWLFLQPNKGIGAVRRWTYENGFHLKAEVWTERDFQLLAFQMGDLPDPAYAPFVSDKDLLEASQVFGPFFLRRRQTSLLKLLQAESRYYAELPKLELISKRRLLLIHIALQWLTDQSN